VESGTALGRAKSLVAPLQGKLMFAGFTYFFLDIHSSVFSIHYKAKGYYFDKKTK